MHTADTAKMSQSVYQLLLNEIAPQVIQLVEQDQLHNNTDTAVTTKNTLFKLKPLIVAYLARLIHLTKHNDYQCDYSTVQQQQQYIVNSTVHAVQQYYSNSTDIDTVLNQYYINTVYLQVIYHSVTYNNTYALRDTQYNISVQTGKKLSGIIELSKQCTLHKTNQQQYNASVIQLYRAIFNFMQYYNNNIQTVLCTLYTAQQPSASKAADDTKHIHIVDHEIAAALESVFPQSGITQYLLISHDNQRYQINILVSVVHGIRLYNKYIEKGGAGIVDIYNTLDKAMQATCDTLQAKIDSVNDAAYTITTLLQLVATAPVLSDIRVLQQHLVFLRQYGMYIQQCYNELHDLLHTAVFSVTESYTAQLAAIQQQVGNKHSVSKELVYPLFTKLSQTYNELLQHHCKYNAVLNTVQQCELWYSAHRDSTVVHSDDVALVNAHILKTAKVQTELLDSNYDKFVTTVSHNTVAAELEPSQQPVRHTIDTTTDYTQLAVQYNGFDCVELIQHNIVCYGELQYGVVCVLAKYYVFTSIDNMRLFCADPEFYIQQCSAAVYKQSQLVNLLGMTSVVNATDIQLYCIALQSNDTLDKQHSTLVLSNKVDAATQLSNEYINTDLQTQPYYWNEWDLMRERIKMANITNMQTHTTQTYQSHYKRDNSSQYTLQIHNSDGTAPGVGTMTRIDKSQNTKTSVQYMNGLRGNGDVQMTVSKLVHDDTVDEHTNRKLNSSAFDEKQSENVQ